MKKLLLFILIFIGQIQANNTDLDSTKTTIKEISFLQNIKNKGIFVSKKGLDVFKFTVDKADKIFSKKFLIGAAILMVPGILVYSKLINPEQAKEIIEKSSQVIAKKATDIVVATTKGTVEGITESVMENKSTIGLYYIAANAIPFLVWATSKMIGPSLDKVGTDFSKFIKIGTVAAPIVSEIAKKFYDIGTQTPL